MHHVDPARTDLAEEFRARPLGPHSPDLQKLLKLLRWEAIAGRYLAVQPVRDGPWHLARTTGPKGHPLDIYYAAAFPSTAEAHWAVFRRRWEQHTGVRLRLPGDRDPLDAVEPVRTATASSKPLLGYPDRFSAAPGERIEFKVSSTLPGEFAAAIVRLRSADHLGVGLKQIRIPSPVDGTYQARSQPIEVGSYVDVADPEPFRLRRLSLGAIVWPTTPGRREHAIAGSWDAVHASGYLLLLDEHGALALRVGDGTRVQTLATGVALLERHWYAVAASVDPDRGELWVGQRPLVRYARDDTAAEASARREIDAGEGGRFRIAAWCADDRPGRASPAGGGFFNGKIESPWVASAPLGPARRRPVPEADAVAPGSLVARWDFARETGSVRVVDVSPAGLHGETVNLPTRAMKGSRWDGSEYHWARKPEHYGAIHFHDDDLYDCAWETDFTLTVPVGLPSGLYCAHLTQDGAEDWIPFVVRPPRGTAGAALALVLPTASYWAYANRHSDLEWRERENVRGVFATVDPSGLYLHEHPELGVSMYDEHSDGSGVCYASRLRPILSLRPKETLWQLPADTHIIDWLEEKGIGFDVLTEDDLDAEGEALLRPYRCVMTGTHPEYPSKRVLDAIAAFQARGGRFIYLGGNGFYWRVSYHPELPGVIEMRRAEDGIRSWLAEGGEYYHSFTGELGGMWRRMGRPPQSVAGVGMTAQGFDRSTFYERTPASFDARAAFIFAGVGADERIGDFGLIGGGAAGWEVDRADPALGTPPHALVVASASDFSSSYHWMKEELTHTHSAITGETCPLVRSDMVFYETPNGGATFATGSIAWAGALSHRDYDNNVSRITENVIRRFLDPAPF